MAKHKDLKDKALADAVAKQPWDPSIQSMAAVPEVVKRLSDDVQWTTDLGNAFLAQQSDVMDAVQRMRKKAKDKGALESNEQQKVETKVVEQKTVIVVESANPRSSTCRPTARRSSMARPSTRIRRSTTRLSARRRIRVVQLRRHVGAASGAAPAAAAVGREQRQHQRQ
jgi:hypothetical protein